MSKLSQLKQEAYKAGKKRDWDNAILLYEQILEKDKNNPTVINELGDLCLKTGDVQKAIRHFLNAAAKYRQTGLLNNAVAIYKKILRYDAQNLNAHWYLAETRAGQGLTVEGESHGLAFLEHSERVTGDIKEIFLKRCVQLFELLPGSRTIQERLVLTFRTWGMNLESARAQCLVASLAQSAGEADEAKRLVDDARQRAPEVGNYPEFQKWNLAVNPQAAAPQQFADFGAVNLPSAAEPEPASVPAPTPAPEPAPAPRSSGIAIPDMDLSLGADEPEIAAAPGHRDILAHADPAVAERDDEGCFSIGDDDGGDLGDIVAEATRTGPRFSAPAVGASAERADDGGLLDQLLSESGDDLAGSDSSQLATITSEIGAVVGGGDADPDRLYEMGTVYLEMGLFDQACASFSAAADHAGHTVRAHEMWGITLQRANRFDEAIEVLTAGLAHATDGSREQLGLRYHLGRTHEEAGRLDEAAGWYREIKNLDPAYLDVGQRLRRLVTV